MDMFSNEVWPSYFDDHIIDEIIWSEIKDSPSRGDFVSYLIHKPQKSRYRESAQQRLEEMENIQSEPIGYPRAVARILAMAEAGDPTAIFHMGKLHVHGIGATQSLIEAEKWYQRGIEAGDIRSHCNLGWIYLYGFDVIPPNKAEAFRLLSIGAEKGVIPAKASVALMLLTGDHCSADPERAVQLLEEAFEEGYNNAGNHLADAYYLGQYLPKDMKKSLEWLSKVADRGDERTMAILGNHLITGAYGIKDPSRGVALFQQAIEKNYVPAYLWIGNLYRHGQGLPCDLDMAKAWFENGLAAGNTGCQQALDTLKKEMEKENSASRSLKH